MTRDQERAFTAWHDQATRAKRRKADRRRKAAVRRLTKNKSRPERLAAQNTMIEANGGRLPPRWRYEPSTKTVGGKTVESIKRIANRPAHISAYPYDPDIDRPGLGKMWAKAAERQARIDDGLKLRENVILSGCLVRAGLALDTEQLPFVERHYQD